jgi:hypothetical protein
MKPRAWTIVVAWLLANAVLMAVLFGFHEWWLAETLYVVASWPILLLAVLTWRSERRRPHEKEQAVRDIGATGAHAVWAAVGAVLAALGVFYAQWLVIVGLAVLLGAGIAAARATAAGRPLLKSRVDLLPEVAEPPSGLAAEPPGRLRAIAMAGVGLLVGLRRRTVRR